MARYQPRLNTQLCEAWTIWIMILPFDAPDATICMGSRAQRETVNQFGSVLRGSCQSVSVAEESNHLVLPCNVEPIDGISKWTG